jgi:hypothetical protein
MTRAQKTAAATKAILGPSGLPIAPVTRVQWEDEIITTACRFSCLDYKPLGQSTRKEYPTLREAVEVAKGNAKPLIYAIHESGRSTLVSPPDFQRFIEARGET